MFCAIILTELLSSIQEQPFALSEISVSKPIILISACAKLTIPNDKKEQTVNKINHTFALLKEKHALTDPNMSLTITEDSCAKTISVEESKKVIDLLNVIKSRTIEKDDNGIVVFEFFRKISLDNGKLFATFAIRSFFDEKFEKEYDIQAQKISELGFNLTLETSSPAWTPKYNSDFENLAVALHKQLFGNTPTIETILGGLDTSIIVNNIPDMQAIGFAPTARGAHTTKERLFINEVPDFWSWMYAILQSK